MVPVNRIAAAMAAAVRAARTTGFFMSRYLCRLTLAERIPDDANVFATHSPARRDATAVRMNGYGQVPGVAEANSSRGHLAAVDRLHPDIAWRFLEQDSLAVRRPRRKP